MRAGVQILEQSAAAFQGAHHGSLELETARAWSQLLWYQSQATHPGASTLHGESHIRDVVVMGVSHFIIIIIILKELFF